MATIHNLDEFRKKKEEKREQEMAHELHDLLSNLILNDEPLIISYSDSDGDMHYYDVNNLSDYLLSDSNPYES
tara:strand:- start:290 stop:508 length:219 start_codon:yes stop_codon:yes gene_type:complete